MKRYNYIHPIDEMERITRKELCEKVDDIIDKVSENDIGRVISDSDRKDLVLCPAHWLLFSLDDNFGCVINSAVRYAIGRHTYMPGVVCGFVRKYLHILDKRTVDVMIEDIDNELMLGIVQEELWVGLRDELIERKKTMKKWEPEDNA